MAYENLLVELNSYKSRRTEIEDLRSILVAISQHKSLPAKELKSFKKSVEAVRNSGYLNTKTWPFTWEVESESISKNEARLVWEAGELVTSEDIFRLKSCIADWCEALFIDDTKNQSRNWCLQVECNKLRNRDRSRKFYDDHRRINQKTTSGRK